jgi:hypothetical protein
MVITRVGILMSLKIAKNDPKKCKNDWKNSKNALKNAFEILQKLHNMYINILFYFIY